MEPGLGAAEGSTWRRGPVALGGAICPRLALPSGWGGWSLVRRGHSGLLFLLPGPGSISLFSCFYR